MRHMLQASWAIKCAGSFASAAGALARGIYRRVISTNLGLVHRIQNLQ